jgi:hypothetical protein
MILLGGCGRGEVAPMGGDGGGGRGIREDAAAVAGSGRGRRRRAAKAAAAAGGEQCGNGVWYELYLKSTLLG